MMQPGTRGPVGPDFIVSGFSKCGSTSLCAMLATHPGICMSNPKETNFFLWEYGRGWDWYHDRFRGFLPGQLRGEGSVFYSATECETEAVTRIVRANPQVRLVWIARHPVKRLESSYREAHHGGHFFGFEAPYSIGDYLREAPVAVEDTRYWRRLDTYLQRLPESQFHVLFLEDLVAEPDAVLARLAAFLGIAAPPRTDPHDGHWLNRGTEKLYDSRAMRLLRRLPLSRGLVRRADPAVIDRWGRLCRLRRPFRGPIHWQRDDLARVLDRVRDDAVRLLHFAGKPTDYWNLAVPEPDAVVRPRRLRAA